MADRRWLGGAGAAQHSDAWQDSKSEGSGVLGWALPRRRTAAPWAAGEASGSGQQAAAARRQLHPAQRSAAQRSRDVSLQAVHRARDLLKQAAPHLAHRGRADQER